MKCLVFSDSHGECEYMRRVIDMHRDAEVIFFLGDGLSDIDRLSREYAERAFFAVKGNCDFSGIFRGGTANKIEEITLLGKKLIITHGDLYNVKYGLENIKSLALTRGADIVLFGHTHSPCEEYVGGEHPFYLFNPASISRPTYSFGILTLFEDGEPLFSRGRA